MKFQEFTIINDMGSRMCAWYAFFVLNLHIPNLFASMNNVLFKKPGLCIKRKIHQNDVPLSKQSGRFSKIDWFMCIILDYHFSFWNAVFYFLLFVTDFKYLNYLYFFLAYDTQL